MTRESQLCTSRHTDGDSAPSEYNLGQDQAENVDGLNSDYYDLPRIRRRKKCHKEFHLLLKLTCLTASSLSSKKTETDRPNLMLQATTMLTTKKQTVVGRPAPEHRSPHKLKPKGTTTPQQNTRRRRRTAAAAL
jgi:hypothetical protein